jgi:hypothetical protein
MTRLNWHEIDSISYNAGADRGVFYPSVGPGVQWDGIVSVNETIEDSDARIIYIDGAKIQTELSLGVFSAELTAVTYPPEFEEYDGIAEDGWTDQSRKTFNFSYRTLVADDEKGIDRGYLIHLVYNVLAAPTAREYSTLDGSIDPTPFSWELTTKPEFIPNLRATSHLIIDSTKVYPGVLTDIENLLYGSAITDPKFPTIQEVMALFESYAIFKVTNLGDGVVRVEGPDSVVYPTGPGMFAMDWPSVVRISSDTFRISSL